MKASWTIKDTHLHACEHGLQVLHMDLELEWEGRKHRSGLAYHLSDVLALPGEPRENLAHLIDVHVASEVHALAALGDPSRLKGLSGRIESTEEVLAGHPQGEAEDHPPAHTHQEEGPGMIRL